VELQTRCGLRIGESLKIKASDVLDPKLIVEGLRSRKGKSTEEITKKKTWITLMGKSKSYGSDCRSRLMIEAIDQQMRYVGRLIRLFLLQLMPLVVDEFKKHIVHLLRMDEGKFTVPERPGFLSSRSRDYGVILRLQLL